MKRILIYCVVLVTLGCTVNVNQPKLTSTVDTKITTKVNANVEIPSDKANPDSTQQAVVARTTPEPNFAYNACGGRDFGARQGDTPPPGDSNPCHASWTWEPPGKPLDASTPTPAQSTDPDALVLGYDGCGHSGLGRLTPADPKNPDPCSGFFKTKPDHPVIIPPSPTCAPGQPVVGCTAP
ncbi:MAG: hypothetical protein JWM80_5307 [Cyanobacteria bacterium RYN_339]|nr:hypothetical protein [Cyanobacteria bacterium RYN_339]